METAQMIMTAISTVGFPIVMCAALFWKMDNQDKEHKEEMQKTAEAINNNTLVIRELVDKFGASNIKE
jgi:hypothetical protein